MNIWIDADACPKAIKEIVIRAAERTKIPVIFVANCWLRLPDSEFVKLIQVAMGADIADDKIAEECEAEDLIVTADIPLAARVIEKGAYALNYRGQMYNKNNIKQVLSIRNFMDDLRSGGVETGGPKTFNKKDQQLFANELDKHLRRVS